MMEANGFLMHGSLAAPNLATPFQQTEDLNAGIADGRPGDGYPAAPERSISTVRWRA